MKNRELATRSLMLSTEFSLYIVEHSEVADEIPQGAVVVLLPEDDPELARYNLEMAEMNREPEQPVVSVRIGKLRPRTSRITKLEMEIAEGY